MRTDHLLAFGFSFLFLGTWPCDLPASWQGQSTPMQEQDVTGKKRHWDHFNYLFALKNDIAKAYWPGFAGEALTTPVLYYTSEGTYAINPSRHILELTHPRPIASPNPEWKVYELPEAYTDTVNFQFANSFSSDPNSLYYLENIMVFSSFELTGRFIPGVTDLQDWSIMVFHEFFHAYQRSVPPYKAYYQNLSIPGEPDSFLGTYHKELPWFREMVHRENEILKEIWQGKRPLSTGTREYLRLQEDRRQRVLKEHGVDISAVEDYEIMAEGHARYFESLAKRYIRDHNTDTSMLSEQDKGLISGMFEGYEPSRDKGLSDIYNDRYWYQLGYNLSMILESQLPEYAETIYESEFNFNNYLTRLRDTASPRHRN